MMSGAWCLYEKRSQRWLFCRRKSVINPGSLSLLSVAAFAATAWLGYL
jgi:hypothetical protein